MMRLGLLVCLAAIGCGHPSRSAPPAAPPVPIAVDAAPPSRPSVANAGEPCSGFAGIPCAAGLQCDFENVCGIMDAEGTCVPRVTSCPSADAPVCACGGKTFANDCERRLARARFDHDGACR